jgi:hypothetical protein
MSVVLRYSVENYFSCSAVNKNNKQVLRQSNRVRGLAYVCSLNSYKAI